MVTILPKFPAGVTTRRARILYVIRRIVVATLLLSVFFLLIQDFLVFPALWGYPTRWFSDPPVRDNAVRHELKSADGTVFEVYEQKVTGQPRPYTAIMFHGNGGFAPGFADYQHWMASLGIRSFMVEYRGYGHSGGWPYEKNLYADAAAAWDFVMRQDGVIPENLIVVGQSIGSGVAAWLAAERKPTALVLISAYSSLTERAAEEPLLGFLAPYFLHLSFPSANRLSTLHDTCVVLAHGRQDGVIGFRHLARLEKALAPEVRRRLVISDTAGHNDILDLTHKDITNALLWCLTSATPASPADPPLTRLP